MKEMASKNQSYAGTDRREFPRNDPLRTAHHDAIYTLARASELHDEDTGEHVLRIRHLVERIALAMGFQPDDAESLGYDAMLHDVGKLAVPPSILQKPGELTERERLMIQSHTVAGERLLLGRPSMQRAARIARSHHEHFDGSGYPDGLAGEDIPIEARITAVADLLDALMAPRVYKTSWPFEKAMSEVMDRSGSALDPDVVKALQRCNAEGNLCELYNIPSRCVNRSADHDAA